jgi:SAM-dependent methyltransferase
MSAPSRYLHGTSPEEQARLSLLNDLLNGACLREISLRGGERILDVGAGLGQFARDMARAAGRPVTAVERSEEQRKGAARRARDAGEEALLDLRAGDALALPLRPEEWGTFDVVHARFLLEHVPAPEQVVAQMARAARPGGRVVVCDDDHSLLRLHPEPPGLAAAWEAFERSYLRLGNDPFVGRRLVRLLADAGLAPRRATWIFFGACSGEASFRGFVENLAGNLAGAADAILAEGTLREADLERVLAELDGFGGLPDAVIGYAMPWAEATRPR